MTSAYERREATRRRLVAEFMAENAEEVRETIVASWAEENPEEARNAIVASWDALAAVEEAEMRQLLLKWLEDRNQRSIVASLAGRDRRAAQYLLTKRDKRRAQREALLASAVETDRNIQVKAYADGVDKGTELLQRARNLKRLRSQIGYDR